MESSTRTPVAPVMEPKWTGIDLRASDNLKFASTSQLLTEYSNSLNCPVSAGTIKAWLNNSYQGEACENGMPNGQGTAQLFGGLTYTGGFKGGLLHGEATLQWGDGLSYTGGFFCNSIHGRGTYRWSGGAQYTGQVFQGLPHGEGCMYTGEDDFCTYEGFWKHGLRHGQGKLVYGNEGKCVYEGYWVEDRKQGEGRLTYSSGSKYRGYWLEGKRHGKGHLVLMTPQASSNNTIANLGRLDLARVNIYEGDWVKDLPHGMGKSIWAWEENEDRSNHLLNKYIGEYNKGTRHGQGDFYYASGALYRGEWKENAKDGKGVFIYEDGHVRCGIFSFDHYELKIVPGCTFPEVMICMHVDGMHEHLVVACEDIHAHAS